jgi:hypothetical protein
MNGLDQRLLGLCEPDTWPATALPKSSVNAVRNAMNPIMAGSGDAHPGAAGP